MYCRRAGGVVHGHHRCVFSKLIKHGADKLLAELYHNVLQLAAEHFENLLRIFCHAIDPGYSLIRHYRFFYNGKMIYAINAIVGGAVRMLAAVCHQIVVVFIEDKSDRLHVVAFLAAIAGGHIYTLRLFIQMKVVEFDLLPANDGILNAVHRVENGFVGVLPGVEAYHVSFSSSA